MVQVTGRWKGPGIPATQLCGMINPVSTQEGLAWLIGVSYPTTYMLLICRGVFNKALGFAELYKPFCYLLCAIPVVIFLSTVCQRKQEK